MRTSNDAATLAKNARARGQPNVSGTIPAVTGAPQVARHAPETIDFYDVSEDQLAMIENQHKDFTAEVMWIAGGGVVGALPASLDALIRFYQAPYVFSFSDLTQIFIFVGSLSALAVSAGINVRRKHLQSNIFSKIRAQKKNPSQA